MNLVTGFVEGQNTGMGSLLAPSAVGAMGSLLAPSAGAVLPVMSAMAQGRLPASAVLTSSYDSLHSFLLRGWADTALFRGFTPGDLPLNGTLVAPPGTGTPETIATTDCIACYTTCILGTTHSAVMFFTSSLLLVVVCLQIGTCVEQQCVMCHQ